MENEKFNITVEQGVKTLEILEGAAPKRLDERPPVQTNIEGTISAPAEFLQKRIPEINGFKCHVLVNEDKGEITLVINEDDPYKIGAVTGKITTDPTLIEFGINTKKEWEPVQLGQFMKMNRSYFENREENMALVTELLNFEAKVNSKVEKKNNEKGEFSDSFSGVVTSNLPGKFRLKIPIFKGGARETIEVEFMADVRGRSVILLLYSPDATALLIDTKSTIIGEQIAKIQEIMPTIPIILQ